MEVREAVRSDFVEVHKLLLSVFPNAAANIGKGDGFFVAEDSGLIGFAHFSEDRRKIVLRGLGVKENARERGAGGMLLDALIARAKRGNKKIYLKARMGSPALSLYKDKGFCVKRMNGETLTLVFRIGN